MYFNGAVNNLGAGIGVILITLKGEMIPMAKRLKFEVTNNQVEYEACIFVIEVEDVTVYGDSMIVMNKPLKSGR